MDLFDLFPMGGPGFPGERSARTPGEQLLAGSATVLLPTANFLLVLLAGIAPLTTVALVVMPLASALLLMVLARVVDVSLGRALVFGTICAALCFTANLGALVLAAIGQIYSGF